MEATPRKKVITFTYRIAPDLYDAVKKDMELEYRTLTGTIDLALRKYLSEKEAQHGNAPSDKIGAR